MGGYTPESGVPLWHSPERDVATAFAYKGYHDGAVYAVDVPLSEIVFSDLKGHTEESTVNLDKEVVVIHRTPDHTGAEVIAERVTVRERRGALNPTMKDRQQKHKKRLQELENKRLV